MQFGRRGYNKRWRENLIVYLPNMASATRLMYEIEVERGFFQHSLIIHKVCSNMNLQLNNYSLYVPGVYSTYCNE